MVAELARVFPEHYPLTAQLLNTAEMERLLDL
jgi:hypothetical protein